MTLPESKKELIDALKDIIEIRDSFGHFSTSYAPIYDQIRLSSDASDSLDCLIQTTQLYLAYHFNPQKALDLFTTYATNVHHPSITEQIIVIALANNVLSTLPKKIAFNELLLFFTLHQCMTLCHTFKGRQYYHTIATSYFTIRQKWIDSHDIKNFKTFFEAVNILNDKKIPLTSTHLHQLLKGELIRKIIIKYHDQLSYDELLTLLYLTKQTYQTYNHTLLWSMISLNHETMSIVNQFEQELHWSQTEVHKNTAPVSDLIFTADRFIDKSIVSFIEMQFIANMNHVIRDLKEFHKLESQLSESENEIMRSLEDKIKQMFQQNLSLHIVQNYIQNSLHLPEHQNIILKSESLTNRHLLKQIFIQILNWLNQVDCTLEFNECCNQLRKFINEPWLFKREFIELLIQNKFNQFVVSDLDGKNEQLEALQQNIIHIEKCHTILQTLHDSIQLLMINEYDNKLHHDFKDIIMSSLYDFIDSQKQNLFNNPLSYQKTKDLLSHIADLFNEERVFWNKIITTINHHPDTQEDFKTQFMQFLSAPTLNKRKKILENLKLTLQELEKQDYLFQSLKDAIQDLPFLDNELLIDQCDDFINLKKKELFNKGIILCKSIFINVADLTQYLKTEDFKKLLHQLKVVSITAPLKNQVDSILKNFIFSNSSNERALHMNNLKDLGSQLPKYNDLMAQLTKIAKQSASPRLRLYLEQQKYRFLKPILLKERAKVMIELEIELNQARKNPNQHLFFKQADQELMKDDNDTEGLVPRLLNTVRGMVQIE